MDKKTKTILIVVGVVAVAFIGYQIYSKNKKSSTATPTITTRPAAFADKPKSETASQTISKVI